MQQLLTIGGITQEAARVLVNNLVFTKHVNRSYDDKFGDEGAKIGSTLNLRLPVRAAYTTGQGLQLQDMIETSVPLTLTTQYQRAFTFTSADRKLSVDDFSDRFLMPNLASLANQIDFDGLNQYQNVYNEVGTPNTVPSTALTYLQAGQRLHEEAAPQDDRYICISPNQNATILNALTGFFNPQVTISKQYDKGIMSKNTLGFDWYMDQNVRIQTVGTLGGTPLVNGAGQTGATLVTNGWTAVALQRLNVGDVFTIAGVNATNPQNFASTGALRQFVVTAPGSSDGSGNMTINISPSIITSGPFQTVTASPANAAALTVQGASAVATPRGLAFHKDAFIFACADLPLPEGVDMAKRMADKQLGLSFRGVRAYDINTDRFPFRFDLLGGWATLYPQLAVRICS